MESAESILQLKIGRSVRFAARDSGGVLRPGRGTLVDITHSGTLIVRLAKDWWGSYLRGREVRVYPDEILPK